MLILTRRTGQSVTIGEGVTVTVLEVKGGRTRLGINAPRDVSVQREELHQRTRRENTAVGDPPPAVNEPDGHAATS